MQFKTVLCIQHHEQGALERKRVKMKVLWELLLGSAEGLDDASSTAFTSTDQEPFEHRNGLCPEFLFSAQSSSSLEALPN